MEFRRLLHPLPLFLIFLFVAVAVGDLVQKLREEPPPPPKLMGPAVPRFEALEPVIDLRLDRADPAVELRPTVVLARGQWSQPGESGVWAMGATAELIAEFTTGGHRVLILDCMPIRGKRSVHTLHLTVNEIDCGKVELMRGWRRYRFELPEEVVRPGPNRVVLGFPDRMQAKRGKRALLVRKLGWFLQEGAGVESLDPARPVLLDFEAERVTLLRSGTLELPLVLEDRTDALQMRYRFTSSIGRTQVEVVQSQAAGSGADAAPQQSASADNQPSGRIRIPLHGRRGAYVLRIRVDLASPNDRLVISALRLVEEGDPTRRPWAVNPPRN
jgi:hypothetical protein